MVVGLGGRAAEEIACEQITAGRAERPAGGDSRGARHGHPAGHGRGAWSAVFRRRGDGGLDGNPYAAWEPKEYSEETARRIDVAVDRLIDGGA